MRVARIRGLGAPRRPPVPFPGRLPWFGPGGAGGPASLLGSVGAFGPDAVRRRRALRRSRLGRRVGAAGRRGVGDPRGGALDVLARLSQHLVVSGHLLHVLQILDRLVERPGRGRRMPRGGFLRAVATFCWVETGAFIWSSESDSACICDDSCRGSTGLPPRSSCPVSWRTWRTAALRRSSRCAGVSFGSGVGAGDTVPPVRLCESAASSWRSTCCWAALSCRSASRRSPSACSRSMRDDSRRWPNSSTRGAIRWVSGSPCDRAAASSCRPTSDDRLSLVANDGGHPRRWGRGQRPSHEQPRPHEQHDARGRGQARRRAALEAAPRPAGSPCGTRPSRRRSEGARGRAAARAGPAARGPCSGGPRARRAGRRSARPAPATAGAATTARRTPGPSAPPIPPASCASGNGTGTTAVSSAHSDERRAGGGRGPRHRSGSPRRPPAGTPRGGAEPEARSPRGSRRSRTSGVSSARPRPRRARAPRRRQTAGAGNAPPAARATATTGFTHWTSSGRASVPTNSASSVAQCTTERENSESMMML